MPAIEGDEVNFKIRKMMAEDLDDILRIEQVSFPTPWSRQAYLSELQNDFAYYVVAVVDEQVVGYAGMWLLVDEAHVTNVAVAPDYRGRQLGEYLLKWLMEIAVLRGARAITLEVRPSNRPAQRLYTRLGFVAAGLRRGYYTDTGEDAIIMWKYLPTHASEEITNESGE
ncbi:MAG: ribosomal protein S18-alanine N-acetyltransferase [Firmicutes bacterium]|nr:ribosomal protein S18-alanine N-acetyltransferase [Bacillota bacterium]